MRIKSLTVISSSPATERSSKIEDVIKQWPDTDCPPILNTTTQQVLKDSSILDDSGVAWLILNEDETDTCFEIIGLLQERHVPAMLTQGDKTKTIGTTYQSGIVAAPLNSDPIALCAMLCTLWNQSAVIRSLQDEVKMLHAHHNGLCDQIGKIDEELRLAAQLQREFLPTSLPSCEKLEFRVMYRPASYVSGDLYDATRLDEHHVGIFIADAAGHGVPAALMTMYIKRSLHSKDIDPTDPKGYRIIPPDEAMARLNNDMVRHQTGKTRFATACYGIIDTRTMEVSIARAGHPFPLILRSNGAITPLEPDGMLLGVFPNSRYDLAHTQLEPGDRLLLYSDGFETAFPLPASGNGKNRSAVNPNYADEFSDLVKGSLDLAMQQLEHKLDQQVGSLNQRDDLTALCIGARIEPDRYEPHHETPGRVQTSNV